MASHTGIIPGVEPPVGVKPNFVNPPSQRGLIIAIAVLAISFSTISVCLRIYTRYFVNRKLWWDDCTVFLPIVRCLSN